MEFRGGRGLLWVDLRRCEGGRVDFILFCWERGELEGQGAVAPAENAGVGLEFGGVRRGAAPADRCEGGVIGGEVLRWSGLGVVVCGGWVEGLVVPRCGLEGQEARDFELVEFAVAGFGDGVSGDVDVHEAEGLLDGFFAGFFWDAVGATFVVAGVEFLIVELAR